MSVDSRATQGPYIASQSVKKVIEINPFLLGNTCMTRSLIHQRHFIEMQYVKRKYENEVPDWLSLAFLYQLNANNSVVTRRLDANSFFNWPYLQKNHAYFSIFTVEFLMI